MKLRKILAFVLSFALLLSSVSFAGLLPATAAVTANMSVISTAAELQTVSSNLINTSNITGSGSTGGFQDPGQMFDGNLGKWCTWGGCAADATVYLTADFGKSTAVNCIEICGLPTNFLTGNHWYLPAMDFYITDDVSDLGSLTDPVASVSAADAANKIGLRFSLTEAVSGRYLVLKGHGTQNCSTNKTFWITHFGAANTAPADVEAFALTSANYANYIIAPANNILKNATLSMSTPKPECKTSVLFDGEYVDLNKDYNSDNTLLCWNNGLSEDAYVYAAFDMGYAYDFTSFIFNGANTFCMEDAAVYVTNDPYSTVNANLANYTPVWTKSGAAGTANCIKFNKPVTGRYLIVRGKNQTIGGGHYFFFGEFAATGTKAVNYSVVDMSTAQDYAANRIAHADNILTKATPSQDGNNANMSKLFDGEITGDYGDLGWDDPNGWHTAKHNDGPINLTLALDGKYEIDELSLSGSGVSGYGVYGYKVFVSNSATLASDAVPVYETTDTVFYTRKVTFESDKPVGRYIIYQLGKKVSGGNENNIWMSEFAASGTKQPLSTHEALSASNIIAREDNILSQGLFFTNHASNFACGGVGVLNDGIYSAITPGHGKELAEDRWDYRDAGKTFTLYIGYEFAAPVNFEKIAYMSDGGSGFMSAKIYITNDPYTSVEANPGNYEPVGEMPTQDRGQIFTLDVPVAGKYLIYAFTPTKPYQYCTLISELAATGTGVVPFPHKPVNDASGIPDPETNLLKNSTLIQGTIGSTKLPVLFDGLVNPYNTSVADGSEKVCFTTNASGVVIGGQTVSGATGWANIAFSLGGNYIIDSYFVAGSGADGGVNKYSYYAKVYVGDDAATLFTDANLVDEFNNYTNPMLAYIGNLAEPKEGKFIGFTLAGGQYTQLRLNELGAYGVPGTPDPFTRTNITTENVPTRDNLLKGVAAQNGILGAPFATAKYRGTNAAALTDGEFLGINAFAEYGTTTTQQTNVGGSGKDAEPVPGQEGKYFDYSGEWIKIPNATTKGVNLDFWGTEGVTYGTKDLEPIVFDLGATATIDSFAIGSLCQVKSFKVGQAPTTIDAYNTKKNTYEDGYLIKAAEIYAGNDKATLTDPENRVAYYSGLSGRDAWASLITLIEPVEARYVCFKLPVYSVNNNTIFAYPSELAAYGTMSYRVQDLSGASYTSDRIPDANNILKKAAVSSNCKSATTINFGLLSDGIATGSDSNYPYANYNAKCLSPGIDNPNTSYLITFALDGEYEIGSFSLSGSGTGNYGAHGFDVYVSDTATLAEGAEPVYTASYAEDVVYTRKVTFKENKPVGKFIIVRVGCKDNAGNNQSWISEIAAEGTWTENNAYWRTKITADNLPTGNNLLKNLSPKGANGTNLTVRNGEVAALTDGRYMGVDYLARYASTTSSNKITYNSAQYDRGVYPLGTNRYYDYENWGFSKLSMGTHDSGIATTKASAQLKVRPELFVQGTPSYGLVYDIGAEAEINSFAIGTSAQPNTWAISNAASRNPKTAEALTAAELDFDSGYLIKTAQIYVSNDLETLFDPANKVGGYENMPNADAVANLVSLKEAVSGRYVGFMLPVYQNGQNDTFFFLSEIAAFGTVTDPYAPYITTGAAADGVEIKGTNMTTVEQIPTDKHLNAGSSIFSWKRTQAGEASIYPNAANGSNRARLTDGKYIGINDFYELTFADHQTDANYGKQVPWYQEGVTPENERYFNANEWGALLTSEQHRACLYSNTAEGSDGGLTYFDLGKTQYISTLTIGSGLDTTNNTALCTTNYASKEAANAAIKYDSSSTSLIFVGKVYAADNLSDLFKEDSLLFSFDFTNSKQLATNARYDFDTPIKARYIAYDLRSTGNSANLLRLGELGVYGDGLSVTEGLDGTNKINLADNILASANITVSKAPIATSSISTITDGVYMGIGGVTAAGDASNYFDHRNDSSVATEWACASFETPATIEKIAIQGTDGGHGMNKVRIYITNDRPTTVVANLNNYTPVWSTTGMVTNGSVITLSAPTQGKNVIAVFESYKLYGSNYGFMIGEFAATGTAGDPLRHFPVNHTADIPDPDTNLLKDCAAPVQGTLSNGVAVLTDGEIYRINGESNVTSSAGGASKADVYVKGETTPMKHVCGWNTLAFDLMTSSDITGYMVSGSPGDSGYPGSYFSGGGYNDQDNKNVLYVKMYVGDTLATLFDDANLVDEFDNRDDPMCSFKGTLATPATGRYVGFKMTAGAYLLTRLTELGVYGQKSVTMTPITADNLPTGKNLLVGRDAVNANSGNVLKGYAGSGAAAITDGNYMGVNQIVEYELTETPNAYPVPGQEGKYFVINNGDYAKLKDATSAQFLANYGADVSGLWYKEDDPQQPRTDELQGMTFDLGADATITSFAIGSVCQPNQFRLSNNMPKTAAEYQSRCTTFESGYLNHAFEIYVSDTADDLYDPSNKVFSVANLSDAQAVANLITLKEAVEGRYVGFKLPVTIINKTTFAHISELAVFGERHITMKNIVAVGDSITCGIYFKWNEAQSKYTAVNAEKAWPKQLEEKLNAREEAANSAVRYSVNNMAISGSAVVGTSDIQEKYGAGATINFTSPTSWYGQRKNAIGACDILCIMLGTNDSGNEADWNNYREDLYSTIYKQIVADFRAKNPNLKLYILTSPSALRPDYRGVLNSHVVPAQKALARELGATLVDINRASENAMVVGGEGAFISEGDIGYGLRIHPAEAGQKLICDTVYDVMVGNVTPAIVDGEQVYSDKPEEAPLYNPGGQIRTGDNELSPASEKADLRFAFTVDATGFTVTTTGTKEFVHVADYTNAQIKIGTEYYKILGMGALLARSDKVVADDMTIENMAVKNAATGKDYIVNVNANKLFALPGDEGNEYADRVVYTAVLTNIPNANFGTAIWARGYVKYKDTDDSIKYLYTDIESRSVSQLLEKAN